MEEQSQINRTLALAYYQSPDFSGAYTTHAEENAPQILMEHAGRQYMLALEMKKTFTVSCNVVRTDSEHAGRIDEQE